MKSKMNETINDRLREKKRELEAVLISIANMVEKDAKATCFENNMMSLLLISKELKSEIKELEHLAAVLLTK